MSRALRIHPSDNVAVALADVEAGASVEVVSDGGSSTVVAAAAIPFAHKVAVAEIAEGADVRKYGVPIGFATRGIAAGEWVHQHNTRSHFEAMRERRA